MCVVCSFYRIIAYFYSSFLALMQEKKQKKIKASGMPANLGDLLMALVYPANFPALGRGPFLALMQEKKQKKIKASAEGGEVCRVHDRWSRDLSRVGLLFFRLLFLAHPFSYVSVPYFPPERVHPDVP